MVQIKDLYTIDDMIKSFSLIEEVDEDESLLPNSEKQESSKKFALYSSSNSLLEDTDENEDIFKNIINHIGSSISDKKDSKKRDLDEYDFLNETNFDFEAEIKNEKRMFETLKSSYLSCHPVLSDDCSQMIIESKEPVKQSLLSYESINIECNFIEQYLKPYLNSGTQKNLQPEIKVESLSNIITKFSSKKTCNQLDKIDLGNFTMLFKYCSYVYKKLASFNLMDLPTLEQVEDLKLSPICRDQNLIDTYNYLIDKDFYFKHNDEVSLSEILNKNIKDFEQEVEIPVVKYTSIYMSVNKRDKNYLLKFYLDFLKPHFLNKPLNENKNKMEIVGLNFDIKQELFQTYVKSSLIFLVISLIFSLFISIILSNSFTNLFTILLTVLFSSLESYFVYKIILKIEYFSFLNIISVFLITGISLINVFLFSDAWYDSKSKFKHLLLNQKQENFNPNTGLQLKSKLNGSKLNYIEQPNQNHQNIEQVYSNNSMFNSYLENCVSNTFKNVIGSILISNLIILIGILILVLSSSIIAIKIFGIYLSISILFNFVLVIFLAPSVLVLQTKYSKSIKHFFKSHLCNSSKIENLSINLENFFNSLNYFYQKIFEIYLPTFIVFYRYILIFVSLLIGVMGLIFVFYSPSLKLTNSANFQLFSSKNPLEYYESYFSLLSESNGVYLYQQENLANLPVSYIFGIRIKDKKTSLFSKEISIDLEQEFFDFYDEKSQLWFLKFCKSLNNTSNANNQYEKTSNQIENVILLDKNENKNLCLFDLLKIVFSRKCVPNSHEMFETMCCEQSFPFDSNVLEVCLKNKKFLEHFIAPYENILIEKLFFNKTNGLIDVVEYQHVTSYEWSSSYSKMSNVYNDLQKFFEKQTKLKYIDLGIKSENYNSEFNLEKIAFFVSNLDFFDFQKSILFGTVLSVLLTLLIASMIILIATRNMFITIVSLFTIFMSLSTTTGLMVLSGIKLSITESISIVLCIYLSISSIVYLGISYSTLLSNNQETDQEFTTMFFVTENTIESLLKRFGSSIFKPSLAIILSFLFMIPCSIYSFQISAIFFILSSFFSLFYTFFLFLPLCTIGPTKNYCEMKHEKSFSQANNQINGKNINIIDRTEITMTNTKTCVFTTSF